MILHIYAFLTLPQYPSGIIPLVISPTIRRGASRGTVVVDVCRLPLPPLSPHPIGRPHINPNYPISSTIN